MCSIRLIASEPRSRSSRSVGGGDDQVRSRFGAARRLTLAMRLGSERGAVTWRQVLSEKLSGSDGRGAGQGVRSRSARYAQDGRGQPRFCPLSLVVVGWCGVGTSDHPETLTNHQLLAGFDDHTVPSADQEYRYHSALMLARPRRPSGCFFIPARHIAGNVDDERPSGLDGNKRKSRGITDHGGCHTRVLADCQITLLIHRSH